jgi:hypothetical protein
MGNVIPWSAIHPSIKSEEPFLAVVIVDPQRQLCVSEMVEVDPETLQDPDGAGGALLAAAQATAARVAGGYRTRRRSESSPPVVTGSRSGLRLIQGGLRAGR